MRWLSMKLTVGDRYEQEHRKGLREEIIIDGIEAMDENPEDGAVIVPRGPRSGIEVSKYDNISCEWRHDTIFLEHLAENWEKIE